MKQDLIAQALAAASGGSISGIADSLIATTTTSNAPRAAASGGSTPIVPVVGGAGAAAAGAANSTALTELLCVGPVCYTAPAWLTFAGVAFIMLAGVGIRSVLKSRSQGQVSSISTSSLAGPVDVHPTSIGLVVPPSVPLSPLLPIVPNVASSSSVTTNPPPQADSVSVPPSEPLSPVLPIMPNVASSSSATGQGQGMQPHQPVQPMDTSEDAPTSPSRKRKRRDTDVNKEAHDFLYPKLGKRKAAIECLDKIEKHFSNDPRNPKKQNIGKGR